MYSKVLNLHQPKNQLPSKCKFISTVHVSTLVYSCTNHGCVSVFSIEDSANGEPAVSAGVGEE